MKRLPFHAIANRQTDKDLLKYLSVRRAVMIFLLRLALRKAKLKQLISLARPVYVCALLRRTH
jgi:hypothetical protein